ncbi:hypothetical protein ACE6H2_019728 [Prunus campanulata]
MGNARRREPRPRSLSQSNNQVIALTTEVAELKGHLSHLLESFARSGIQIPPFGTSSTSEPLQQEQGHHTSAPVNNVHTSEPHLLDDQVDFGTLFD